MTFKYNKITIIKLRKPSAKEVNKDLQWFSTSLGLFGERDKEKSCFRVFVELIKGARKNYPMTSDELALKSHLTRATVIHHLHKLMESGIVINHGNRYFLRSDNLENLTLEINHKDGTKDSFEVKHSYNKEQIEWFKAGSALNLL